MTPGGPRVPGAPMGPEGPGSPYIERNTVPLTPYSCLQANILTGNPGGPS